MKRAGKRMRRPLALLIVTALFAGILPVGTPTASQAASSASTEKTAGAGYGLNNPRTDADGVTTWDCVWFGNYWQEDTNGDGKADKNDAKTPIKWRVLSVEGDDAFLLADKNIDVQQYNKSQTSVIWETCTMRSWLNGYGAEVNKNGIDYSDNNFLNNAFSNSEQSAIRTTHVVNDDNPFYGTEGGNDTSDKVYLLSIDEVTNPAYGFSSNYSKYDEARRAKNTEYAKAQGAYTATDEKYAGNGVWWLRSPGDCSGSASGVTLDGQVFQNGSDVSTIYGAARAALHLNLKAPSGAISTSSWSYAGTVTSNGGDTGTVTPTDTAVPSTPTPSSSPAEPLGTPGKTMNPGINPTATPATGQTLAPTATTTPATIPTATPDAGQTVPPVSTATAVPTSVPGTTPTAVPTIAPGSEVPLPSVSLPQLIAPVIQPPVLPAPADIGKISSVKLKQKKQAVTISWKKVSGAAGYQICYSTSKKWKGKKQKLTRNNKLTVKKLTKKKTYYFRVRAYRINGTGKLYGAWSKTKKITIKK